MKRIKMLMLAAIVGMAVNAVNEPHKTTIFMIGDSTMANKKLDGGSQERGWGEMLPGFFTEDVVVDNHAQNGRSSKSFIDEGLWDVVYEKMQPGDYLIIQFGHNDEKADEKRHTDPGTTYDANLRRFIAGARAKGATPIICNSIVRRNFGVNPNAVAADDKRGEDKNEVLEGDSLIETHGEYINAARKVAEAEGVVFIDMNRLTRDYINALGNVKSRELFVWAEPNTVAAYPKGRKDNTHLNVHGGRVVASMAARELQQKVPALAPYIRFYDIVVAQDGTGDFFTIQEAINAVPDYSKNRRTTIMIRGGVYKEKVIVPESKLNLSIVGQSGATITYDDYASRKNKFGDECSTSGSASFYVYADNFYCENLTFENTAGRVGQAVACFVSSNGAHFVRCKFLGNQDTLYTYGDSDCQKYEDCYIEGTVDFIFGKATCYFKNCEIRSLAAGYVCAPATPENRKYGYVFDNCRLTAAEGVNNVYLARPWRPYAQAVFINCEMDDHIKPEGWNNWGKQSNEKTAFFAEFNTRGKGANAKARAKWSHQLENADRYSEKLVLTIEN
ncbi:MAG: pectin esterase [Bacteroidales bacterium]|jgi:pectinesterase|nr:pectin esterase [Bacteroidales bacterium]MBP5420216.1 pectin esterase [Bacteroidales bacterium]